MLNVLKAVFLRLTSDAQSRNHVSKSHIFSCLLDIACTAAGKYKANNYIFNLFK
jgi:hypothetical protein